MTVFDSLGAQCAAENIARNMCKVGTLRLWDANPKGVKAAMAAAETNLVILARTMGYTLAPIAAPVLEQAQ